MPVAQSVGTLHAHPSVEQPCSGALLSMTAREASPGLPLEPPLELELLEAEAASTGTQWCVETSHSSPAGHAPGAATQKKSGASLGTTPSHASASARQATQSPASKTGPANGLTASLAASPRRRPEAVPPRCSPGPLRSHLRHA